VISSPADRATVSSSFGTNGSITGNATMKATLIDSGGTPVATGTPNPYNATAGTWAFSFAGVPAGTYTLLVKAINPACGSAIITVTVQ
jgi:hypothetical protein